MNDRSGGQVKMDEAEVKHRFAYHKPDAGQVARIEMLRCRLEDTANSLCGLCGPASRERSLAITKLEEVMFWAIAAIAREKTSPASKEK